MCVIKMDSLLIILFFYIEISFLPIIFRISLHKQFQGTKKFNYYSLLGQLLLYLLLHTVISWSYIKYLINFTKNTLRHIQVEASLMTMDSFWYKQNENKTSWSCNFFYIIRVFNDIHTNCFIRRHGLITDVSCD